jgi:hypothetical protein
LSDERRGAQFRFTLVLEVPGKGEQKRHRVGGEMLIAAVVHAGNDDIAVDQRTEEPRATQAYA